VKTNEAILLQFGTSGLHSKAMKQSTLGSRGQRSRSQETRIGQTCDQDILKMKAPILPRIGISGPREWNGQILEQS